MSLCRESRKGKSKENGNIDLSSILTFIKIIQSVSAMMLGISIIGLLLVNDKSAQTIYIMVIIVNLITAIGGIIPIRYLKNKAQKLV